MPGMQNARSFWIKSVKPHGKGGGTEAGRQAGREDSVNMLQDVWAVFECVLGSAAVCLSKQLEYHTATVTNDHDPEPCVPPLDRESERKASPCGKKPRNHH